MPNLTHLIELFAAVVGGGLGGWVLRWGQHRDDCRAFEHNAELDGYDRGWADCERRHATLEGWTERTLERQRDNLASVMLEESAGELAGHTVYPQLAPEVLAAEDMPRPEGGAVGRAATETDLAAMSDLQADTGLGHSDEAGDETLTRMYIAQGGWERDQQAIAATEHTHWFLAWQQRQAVA